MTWLRAKPAGKDETRYPRDAGRTSRQTEYCAVGSSHTAFAALHHRLLLQCMQIRLQHGTGDGSAPTIGQRLSCGGPDHRATAHDHTNDEAKEDAARMDVVLLEPQYGKEKTSSCSPRMLAGSGAHENKK